LEGEFFDQELTNEPKPVIFLVPFVYNFPEEKQSKQGSQQVDFC